MKESDIQARVSEFAPSIGLIPIRIAVVGRKGWPDYGYMYQERICFIEFKKPGKKAEPLQAHVHELLKKAGFLVAVVDNVSYGITLLEGWKRHVDQELATFCGRDSADQKPGPNV